MHAAAPPKEKTMELFAILLLVLLQNKKAVSPKDLKLFMKSDAFRSMRIGSVKGAEISDALTRAEGILASVGSLRALTEEEEKPSLAPVQKIADADILRALEGALS